MLKIIVLVMTLGQAYSFDMDSSTSKPIEAYFNHNEANSYTEPYRNITRSGDNLERVIIDAIESARVSIDLAVQELRLPLIAKALVRKQNEGVKVRVIVENTYNHDFKNPPANAPSNDHNKQKRLELRAFIDINRDNIISQKEISQRDAIHILNTGNIPIRDDAGDGSQGSGLMHHKFMVVDSKRMIITSANFTMSGIHGDMLESSSRGNANSLLEIFSEPLSKRFREEFSLMWGSNLRSGSSRLLGGTFGTQKKPRPLANVKVGSSSVYSQFSPTKRQLGFRRSVNGTITKFLARAKKNILISLFVFSDQQIANQLEKVKKANKKLDLRILIERKFATRDYSELLDMWGVQMLNANCEYEEGNRPWKSPIKAGGTPRLNSGDVLHHKFAVIDDETVIMGSHNWTQAANYTNDESILVVKNKYIAQKYKKEFDRLNNRAIFGVQPFIKRKIKLLEQKCSLL